MPENYSKWVACWGNATSITDRKEATYAKDLTLRYPIRACFSGNKLRFHFSNLTGTEPVTISEAYFAKDAAQSDNSQTEYAPTPITFCGNNSGTIPAGEEILSDEIAFNVCAGDTLNVSLYFAGFTQMNAGTA
ncbi:MAG: lipase, partial [Fibrobacter sp.]|nr:lipase [Fibrobacter sp.]